MATRPCMHCGAPLLPNGDCRTAECPYNPAFDNVEFDSEVEVEQGEGELLIDTPDLPEGDQIPEDDFDPYDPENYKEGGQGEGNLQDEMPEPEKAEKIDSPDELSDEGQGELPDPDDAARQREPDTEAETPETQEKMPEELPQENESDQKLDPEGGQEPDEFAHDDLSGDEGQPEMPDPDADDDDLPPRPQGCNGDCKPGDQYDEDAVPCPHCTAKSFRDQMDQEDKRKDQQEMQQDWQNFLDNWENQNQEKRQKDLDDFIDGLGDEGEKDLPDEKQEPEPEGITCDECGSFIADAVDQGTPGPEHKDSCSLHMPDDPEGEEDVPEEPENDTPPEEEMQDGEEEPEDEPEVPEEAPEEEDSGEFKRVADNMTIGQEKRFDNIVKRLTPKVENTFGKTNEDFHKGAKTKGQFDGEEVSQTIQIQSRGVTYFVTISAMKS